MFVDDVTDEANDVSAADHDVKPLKGVVIYVCKVCATQYYCLTYFGISQIKKILCEFCFVLSPTNFFPESKTIECGTRTPAYL